MADNHPIAEITKKYRQQRNISLDEFAKPITENTEETLTRAAVSTLEMGIRTPGISTILLTAMRHSDWRRDWAFECLAVKNPELYSCLVTSTNLKAVSFSGEETEN